MTSTFAAPAHASELPLDLRPRRWQLPGLAIGAVAMGYMAVTAVRHAPYAVEEEMPGHAVCTTWSIPCTQADLDAHLRTAQTSAYVTIALVLLALVVDAAFAPRRPRLDAAPLALRALALHAAAATFLALTTALLPFMSFCYEGHVPLVGLAGLGLVFAHVLMTGAIGRSASPARARAASLVGMLASVAAVLAVVRSMGAWSVDNPADAWPWLAVMTAPVVLLTVAAAIGSGTRRL